MSDLYSNPNDIPWFRDAVEIARLKQENHSHVTRMLKPAGECYGCDRVHALGSNKRIFELEDLILFIEELYESDSAQAALRHLQHYIQDENLREKHKDVNRS